jgi:glycosyltransferase involved in cell wall biosynthesis
MKKKRVLIAVSTYPPAFGGSGLQVHRLYRRLSRELPIEVTALTQSGRGQPAGTDQHEVTLVRRIDPTSSWVAQFVSVGRFMLGQGGRPFDLLHASDSPPIVLCACIWARLLKVPMIREITLPVKMTSTPWKARVLRSTFTTADRLFGVNDTVLAEYVAMGIPRERIWMSPYPVDTDAYRFPTPEQRQRARASFGFDQDDIVHFLLGRIQARKNQHLAVQALSLLPGHHKLILAGPASDAGYLEEIRTTVESNKLGGRVILLPSIQHDPLPLYHATDIYLTPSLREGGPNVVFEALCCGVPVIVSEGLGLRRYVHDGTNGFNVSLDADEFAGAAARLTCIASHAERRRAIAVHSAELFGTATLDRQYAQQIAELLRV